MWIDATVAASFVTNPKESKVADKVGFALAPDNGLGKRGNWLWAWSLAVPAGSQKTEAAQKFIAWATSKDYPELVASKEGWANVPPGTRTSLYENPEYQKAAPFAKMTLDSINSADPTKPTVKPVPYVGVQFVAIPEFQGLGTTVGQLFSAALVGRHRRSTQALAERPGEPPARNDQGRLHQVALPPSQRRLAGRAPSLGAAGHCGFAVRSACMTGRGPSVELRLEGYPESRRWRRTQDAQVHGQATRLC